MQQAACVHPQISMIACNLLLNSLNNSKQAGRIVNSNQFVSVYKGHKMTQSITVTKQNPPVSNQHKSLLQE